MKTGLLCLAGTLAGTMKILDIRHLPRRTIGPSFKAKILETSSAWVELLKMTVQREDASCHSKCYLLKNKHIGTYLFIQKQYVSWGMPIFRSNRRVIKSAYWLRRVRVSTIWFICLLHTFSDIRNLGMLCSMFNSGNQHSTPLKLCDEIKHVPYGMDESDAFHK